MACFVKEKPKLMNNLLYLMAQQQQRIQNASDQKNDLLRSLLSLIDASKICLKLSAYFIRYVSWSIIIKDGISGLLVYMHVHDQ